MISGTCKKYTLFLPSWLAASCRISCKSICLNGGKEYKIDKFQTSDTCVLFGFDSYLMSSVVPRDLKIKPTVQLKKDGTFDRLNDGFYLPIKEITCYNDGEFSHLASANGVIYFYDGNVNSGDFENRGVKLIRLSRE